MAGSITNLAAAMNFSLSKMESAILLPQAEPPPKLASEIDLIQSFESKDLSGFIRRRKFKTQLLGYVDDHLYLIGTRGSQLALAGKKRILKGFLPRSMRVVDHPLNSEWRIVV